MPAILDAIRQEMARRGMTQTRVAELAGVAQPHVSRALKTGSCSTRTADRLLAALDLVIVRRA